jgi:hypothetical protein
MAISMGVLCEKCGTLHLINGVTKNRLDRIPKTDSNIFVLRCVACLSVRSFSRGDLRAYLVSDDLTTWASRSAHNTNFSQ